MRKEKIGLSVVEIYDNIEEMPIARWHKYQKYSLIDSGIGSDLTSIDSHLARVGAFIRKGETDKAATEMENLRQNIFLIQQGTDVNLLSCACLIKSIDGEECDDLTEDGLRKTIDRIADVPTGLFSAIIMAVKKKIETELQAYFPNLVQSAGEKEYANLVREHTLETLKDIQGCGDKKRIEELHDKIITSTKPTKFTGDRNFEIDFDKQYEQFSLVLAQKLNIDPKRCTVMEFYNAYELIKEQGKQQQRYGRH